jgi:hypothetical protein
MGKINVGRVILGGIIAGIIIDGLDYLVDGIWLAPKWAVGNKALGLGNFSTNQMIWFNVLGIITGIALIWLYAAIRPRFGAGVKTAIVAGIAVWFITALLPNAGYMWVGGLYSHRLAELTTLGGLVYTLIAAVAGATLYKEAA